MNFEYNNNYIEKIKQKIKLINGIEKIFLLDYKIKTKIIELENEANGKVLIGMGIGDNQGIKTAFNKKYLFALISNKEYKWPSPPNVIMKQNEKIIGFDCTEEEAKVYSKNNDYIVLGTFVIDTKKLPKESSKPVVILPSKSFEELNILCPGINAVIASPSTPSDEYIYIYFNEQKKEGNGTIIVGFD